MNHRVMYLDLANALHRGRGGFQLGPAPVVFNFFRGLRALVEQIKPSRVVCVDEGHPKKRLELFPEYKANRIIPPEDLKRQEEMRKFRLQRDVCIKLLKENFPVSVVRHPDHEADDLLACMVERSSKAVEQVVVSTDSDFIQLLCGKEHVKLYNPVKKTYLNDPGYSYAAWKALRGDPTDNVPPVLSGSQDVMDKRAQELAEDPKKLEEFLKSDELALKFSTNLLLISFEDISNEELLRVESSSPVRDWSAVKEVFASYEFKSIVDKGWNKFVNTFDPLFGAP